MFTRARRLTILLLAIVTVALAGYRVAILQQRQHAASSARDGVDRQAAGVTTLLQELGGAQQAYVAAGQNEQIWSGKVSALVPQISEGLTLLQRDAQASGTRAEAASAALAAFGKADIRAREYLRDGQALMASDVIFSEARDAVSAAIAAVDELRRAETTGQAAAVAALEREQLLTLGAAAAALILLVVALVPIPRAADEAPTAIVASAPGALSYEERAILDQPFRLDEPLVTTPASDAEDVALGAAAPRPPSAPGSSSASTLADDALGDLATLCTDFGRIADGSQIGDLLARAATLAHATGLILWVADRSGQVLHAVAAHGYDARVLARLGPIPRTAENATAAAYRAAHVHTVSGDATRNGAVVVPLLSPDGCIGVLTAEVPTGDERRPATRAMAAIVAAQLAPLVAALPSNDNATRG